MTDDEARGEGLYLGADIPRLRDQATLLFESNRLLLAARKRAEQAFLRTAEKLRRCEDLAEAKRQDRWFATVNAVLGGLYSGTADFNVKQFSLVARAAADYEHGPLVKP